MNVYLGYASTIDVKFDVNKYRMFVLGKKMENL